MLTNILNFFDHWSAAIQAIMVIVMVMVTSFYAWRTHQMAKIMAVELEFNQMPLLVVERDIDRGFDQNNDKKIQLQFSLRNVGKVPIKYITNLLILNEKDINPPQSGAILIPGQNGKTFSNKYIDHNGIRDQGNNLKGEIRITYWTEGKSERKFMFKRKFQLVSNLNTFVFDEEIEEIV